MNNYLVVSTGPDDDDCVIVKVTAADEETAKFIGGGIAQGEPLEEIYQQLETESKEYLFDLDPGDWRVDVILESDVLTPKLSVL